MRKLTFVLILVALLVVSTAVVYAGWSWGGDPPIGHGVWLSLTVTADDEPADGWTPADVQYTAEVKNHHGELEAEVTAWIAHYEEEEEDRCTLSVALTDGYDGPVLATKSGSCGHEVKVKWESD